MQRLAGVLFEVQADDADLLGGAVGEVEDDAAAADDRVLVLADLIALRQIRVKIVLALENRNLVDLGFKREAGFDRLFDAEAVQDRQHAGHTGIYGRYLGVGLGTEGGRRAAEELGLRDHLGVDLEAAHQFPLARAAADRPGHLRPPPHPAARL